MKKVFFIILSLILITGCDPKIDEITPSSGRADFSRFIAVGNSLVAGYSNSALYHNGQIYSIPNILAGQLKLVGAGNFIQPLVNSEYGIDFPGSAPKLKLGYRTDCRGIQSLGPVPDIGAKDPLQPVGYQVHNLGIPGVKSFHMIYPGYALANPYYARFATNAGNMVIEEIPPLNPTFFVMWLGDNDVLVYAISGGEADSITPQNTFAYALNNVFESLINNGAKGVVATIPDITTIPFFTTVPYNGLVLPRQSLVDSVNMAMQLYQLPFVYQLGPNPFLIPEPNSPHPLFKVRQMKPGELVLMTVPQDSIKCSGMGLISAHTFMPYPIPDHYILTENEIADITNATAGFNQTITNLAQTHELGVVDISARLAELQSGIVWDGIKMSTKYVTGGVFSLDGIHMTPRGCAVAANYFIDEINAQYESMIPQVDVTKYPGEIFP
jgi:hypothetical protein